MSGSDPPQRGLPGRAEMILSQFPAARREAVLKDRSVYGALAALAGHSSALIQALSARLDLAEWLFWERSFQTPAAVETFEHELAALARNDAELPALQKTLRRFRIREMARLAVRDLTGRADLAEVTATLSALADASIRVALDKALAAAAAKFGVSAGRLPFAPVVMGMGKLGAGELNYSSDVDLIYLYRPSPEVEDPPPLDRSLDAVFGYLTKAISEVTPDGLVFRVDLDLRPGGKDGAMAQSLETCRRHYLVLGQSWERMAWIKARPAAGDLAAGRELIADLSPFVFRRHLDYTAIEELRDLKRRFQERRRARIRSRGVKGRPVVDVKLSPGGIREIEFFVQALTLTFGGRLPHLRVPATISALAALADEGVITGADRDELGAAYDFLRRLEHRLQLRELTQTQVLPKNREAMEELGRAMGFESDPDGRLQRRLKEHRSAVGRRFDQLLAEPGAESGEKLETPGDDWAEKLTHRLDDRDRSIDLLGRAGFQRPESAWSALTAIRSGRFLPVPLSRYQAQLARIYPAMLTSAVRTPDPDRAVLHWERFFTAIGPRAGFLVLLEDNPKLIELLSVLFGHSDFLAGILIAHPGILDSLIDRRSTAEVKSRKRMADELAQMIGSEDDPETVLNVIRRFKNDETLRIGLYDLLGRLDWTQVTAQLSDLAETVIAATLPRAAFAALGGRLDDPGDLPLAVMGLGKLGGRELTYGSDLDLIFILGRRGGVPPDQAVRAAQRLISFLSIPLDAGPGYEIDSRLRPSGRGGPLVVTSESFAHYHRASLLWERQALLKMRRVAGPGPLGGRVKALANQALFGRPLPDDAAAKIHDLKQRMVRERGRVKPGTINFKFSPGGLVDVEFATQYLQLVYGRHIKGPVRSPNTRTALAALAARKDLGLKLDGLADAYERLSRAAGRLALVYNRSGDRAAFTPDEIDRALAVENQPTASADIQAALDRVAAVYAVLLADRGPA